MPPDLLQRFEDYDWPGNVRELHTAVANRLALGDLAGMSKPAVASRGAAPESSGAPTPATPTLPTVTVPVELPFSMARQRVIEDFERACGCRVRPRKARRERAARRGRIGDRAPVLLHPQSAHDLS